MKKEIPSLQYDAIETWRIMKANGEIVNTSFCHYGFGGSLGFRSLKAQVCQKVSKKLIMSRDPNYDWDR